MKPLFIQKHITIKDFSVFIDGVLDFSSSEQAFMPFIKEVYKHYGVAYSKFYKMDALAKLGFMASELLLADSLKDTAPEETAIILANASSSLHTDTKYQATIETHPSPSVFVYTLPNIVIGEICIRHEFRGETMFFVQDHFDATFMVDYVSLLFDTTPTKQAIVGWVEINPKEEYVAELFLVSKTPSAKTFNATALNFI